MLLTHLTNRSTLELKKAGVKTADLDVQVLVEHAIAKDRAFTFSHPDFLITNAQYSRFRRYIKRRKAGEPIAYILGHKEFYGLDFFVNKNVLIPRPETEFLIEESIKFLKNNEARIMKQEGDQKFSILDMGTGSGDIIISLMRALHNSLLLIHNSSFMACDVSQKALAVAKKNAQKLNATNITFLKSDLFSNRRIKNKKFDLIIANLPYVPKNKSKVKNQKSKLRNGISFEPQDAIFANDNGTSIIKKFLDQTRNHISDNGLILLELDPRNAIDIENYAKKCFPKAQITLKKDLAGLNRYLKIELGIRN